MESSVAEINQAIADANSNAAKIRADVDQVQNEVDTAKTANSASVEALKSDIDTAKQDLANVHDSLTKAQSAVEQNQKLINDSVAKISNDIAQDRKDLATAQQNNADLAKQLDDYSKQAEAQGKTIKSIQNDQNGFTATLADVKGNVSQVSDKVDGLSAGLKDAQGNIASVKAQADQLNATLSDHSKNIAQLTATAKELSSTLKDADGRLSKVEQTAKEHSSTLSDLQGNLSQVKQTATDLVTTLKDAQGNIDQIKQDAKGTLEQLSNVQGDITALQKDVSGIKLTIADHDKNIHTLQADSKSLHDDMKDAQGNISSLQKTATSLDSEFKDHNGRISKVEQTASELINEFSDQQGHLNRVDQTAQGTQQTVANQQGQINTIKNDAAGIHQTITGQGNQIANINVTLNGLSSKYEGVEKSGDELKNRLNNLSVGTRNLLHDTNDQYRTLAGSGRLEKSTALDIYTSVSSYHGGDYFTYAATITNNSTKKAMLEVCLLDANKNPLSASGQAYPVLIHSNSVAPGLGNDRKSVSFRITSDTWFIRTCLVFDGGDAPAGSQIQVKDERLVEGSMAGTWSPNPTDVVDKITTNSTQINQNKKAITLKADQTTVDNLSGEVSQNKAQLKIQSGQISSKVSSTDFKTLNDKVGNLQAGSRNLVVDGDANAYGATPWGNTTFRTHLYYYNSTKLMFVIDTSAKTELTAGCPNWFPVKAGHQYTLYFNGFMSSNVSSYDVWLLGKQADAQGIYTDNYQIITGERLDPSHNRIVTRTFTVPSSWSNYVAYIRFDNNGSTDGKSAVLFFNEVSVKEGNINTGYSPAPEDSIALIKKNTTAINQTNKQISLKADQTEVDKVKQTASQNSSQLNVMANEIKSKVTSTDVNNIVDKKGYAMTSTVQSLISQKAGTINENITNLTDKFNNMKIGGRNLLANTDKDINVTSYTTYAYPAWVCVDTGFSFEHGKTYTFSAEAKNSTSKITEASVRVFESSTNTQVGIYAFPADGNRHSVTFAIPKDSHDYHLLFYAGHAGIVPGVDVTTTYHHPKLEFGNVATDWTPAPSDNATVTQVQQITASIDGLQSTVANKADKSQITQLSNVIQSKVSTSDFTSKVSQLSTDINARVTKGNLLSQINVEAGRTLIQSNKIYFDADTFVMSANSKAFIPSAYITNINADKITTGTLDASKIYVKNFSAGMISGGVLKGVVLKSGSDDRFFQTSSDNIYWSRTGEYGDSIIGTDRYLGNGDYQGLVVADDNYVMLANWGGASYENGKFDDNVGLIGWPRIVLDYRGYWNSDVGEFAGGHGNTIISSWISKKEYLNVEEHKGVLAHLDDSNSDSKFSIQKDNKVGAYFGEGNNGNQINFAFGGDGGGFNVNGPLHVTGSKNSIVETKQGYLAINAYETAEYYFGDIGESNTGDTSQITIGIDRIFNETVNTDIQYQVFVTPYTDAHVWVEKRYNNRFVVKSDKPNAEFGWELKAKRKGYESNRLRRVDVDFNHA